MTITLEGTTVGYVDIWVKVTLKGDGTLTDAEGQALDGEARADGSGRGYIYSAALDLPTGDGTPGNDAVFYVGSLRGDFNGDLSVGSDDLLGFRNAWLANSLDADFRGVGFGPRPPDGRITIGDTDGFSSVYQTAIAQDIHLDPLPLSGSGLAGGVPLLPPLASTSPEVDVLAQAAGWLPSNPQAPLGASRTNDIFFSLNDEDSAALLGVRRVRPVAVGAGGGLPVLRL
jgi:hypothetical protein